MPTTLSTSATRKILNERVRQYDPRLARREMRMLNLAARRAQQTAPKQFDIWINDYTPYLSTPNSWLSGLEARIRESVLPAEYEGEPSTEWLNESAANAAIAFFRAGADLLPGEPHIYATKSGDLVAEFETAKGSMTTVVSDKETIVFAVLSENPHNPIQRVIQRGSNEIGKELRSVTKELTLEAHGQMEARK